METDSLGETWFLGDSHSAQGDRRCRMLSRCRVRACACAFLCVRACGSLHARVHACVCARTQSLRLSLFASVRACVSTRARVDWRASAQQRAATLDSLAACVSLTLGWRQYRWDAATRKWLSSPKQYFIDSDQTLAQGGHRCVADA